MTDKNADAPLTSGANHFDRTACPIYSCEKQ